MQTGRYKEIMCQNIALQKINNNKGDRQHGADINCRR